MLHFKKFIFPLFIALWLIIPAKAQTLLQEPCGTEPYNELLRNRGQILEDRNQFEKWLSDKIKQRRERLQFRFESEESQTIVIPVVVHIIHNDEPIGSGLNIPDAQIHSQIAVINKDFRRENTDANQTPAEFLSVAGNMDIQFVLAKRDPEGLPTNGIVRKKGTKTSWGFNNDIELKSMSYWPAEDYLNIWVTNLADNNIGYAQFPVSDQPGLESSSTNRLTDGIVIGYRHFGSIDDGSFNISNNYNKGRTTTHEIGHFFGLLHIWGLTNNCGSTDYVDDTPEQQRPTSGCPTHPSVSCGSNNMFQNYMDYSHDRCMNIFSAGQVNRMMAVLQNSPRRKSLINSPGAVEPTLFDLDLGIRSIASPQEFSCPGLNTPQIEIRNYGNTIINEATITFRLNGVLQETKQVNLNLNTIEIGIVSFNPISIVPNSASALEFEIVSVNGTVDQNPDNNRAFIQLQTPAKGTLPLFEAFNTLPGSWRVINPDGQFTWQIADAPKQTITNKSAFINLYDYEYEGNRDYLVTPVFDFSNINVAFLDFEVAYARFASSANFDSLLVIVSTNCDFQFGASNQKVVFRKGGATLATAPITRSFFTPNGAGQWRRESINLSEFIGQDRVQIAFVAVNGHGNNIYMDDVSLIVSEEEDLVLDQIISPSVVSCNESPEARFIVKNAGTINIRNFQVRLKVNSNEFFGTYNGPDLLPLNSYEIIFPNLSLPIGEHQIEIEVFDPNGREDVNPNNNILTKQVVVDKEEEVIPVRQTFSSGFKNWINVSPESGDSWQLNTSSQQGNRVTYPGWDNNAPGTSAWLVSPLLNFKNVSRSALFFEVSYGFAPNKGTETLQIWISEDCGKNYSRIIYEKSGNALATAISNQSWSGTNSRREYVSLNSVVGLENVRLAFVVINGQGNNVFLDNIEIFADDDPNPLRIESTYAIYPGGKNNDDFSITFNLEERERVWIQVFDATGREMYSNIADDVLNQTIGVSLPGKPSGMFIVRLSSRSLREGKKIYILR